jgi:diguanylate cyclase (GGDEF)-like protein
MPVDPSGMRLAPTAGPRLLAPFHRYVAGGVLALVCYLAVPPFRGSPVLFAAISGSPVIAILWAIRLHRPRARMPWLLFALGQALFFAGDLYTYLYPQLAGHDVPFPSAGDALYLAMYPVLMVGVALVARRRAVQGDRTAVVDALIVTLGVGLLSWLFLMEPYVVDATLSATAKAVSIAYPLGDVLLAAAALRLVLDGGRRQTSFRLFVAAVCVLFATDAAYGYALLAGTFHHQLVYDAGWGAFYLLWGATALHPSMTTLAETTVDRERRLSRTRIALLTFAAVLAPAVELVRQQQAHDVESLVILGASIVLFLLVVLRVAGLVRQFERALGRERVLQELATALVSSLRRDEVHGIALAAARALAGPAAAVRLELDGVDAPAPPGALVLAVRTASQARGTLVVEASPPLSSLLERSLRTLADSVALSLGSIDALAAEHEAQLSHQSLHDSLTGLPNRTLFADRVVHALERAPRGASVAVLCLDLDDFTTVNDSLGHAAGDRVLEQVGARLLGLARPADTVARFGGDEFAILLEDVAGAEAACELADRIVAALAPAVAVAGTEVAVHPSIGIALAGGRESSADELVRDADAAMHSCKRSALGGYRVFEPAMHAQVVQRLELQAELRRAVELGQFELRFQPLVRLDDGAVDGFEALCRWRHPTHGLVPPDQFIPLAEETGLIVPIGRWVLREACRQTRALPPGSPAVHVAVNLSVAQLRDASIVEDVRRALADSGLAPGRLVLEITESTMVADTELAVARLGSLRELGVRIALDDFGTGYSSLGQLDRLPIDVLKMDRSFVRGDDAPEGSSVVAAIVALGQALDLEVVAEGIEQPAQLAALRALGCTLGQGYLFAPPLTIEELAAWLRDLRARGGYPVAPDALRRAS